MHIKKESKKSKEDEHKIKSPYTIERKNERIRYIISYIAILLLIIFSCYLLYTIATTDKENDENNLVYGGIYEFTK